MIYRVIHGRHTSEQHREGWHVEHSAPGALPSIVSRLFDAWLEARVEAERLDRQRTE
jgi:hypothetical protein